MAHNLPASASAPKRPARRRRSPDLLYRLVKLILQVGIRIFYSSITIYGRDGWPKQGAVIFAANHPNSITDAIVLWAIIPHKVNYLAHAGLFRNPLFGWFLRACGVIPVYRAPARIEGKQRARARARNDESFRHAYAVLEEGEAIGIFPEGTSHLEQQVKRIKTGAARIALEAEDHNGWQLGVQIVPLGLNFEDKGRFRTRVLVVVGRPIAVARYADLYRQDATAAAQQLTDKLQERMERLVVNIHDVNLTGVVQDVKSLYAYRLRGDVLVPDPERGPLVEDWAIEKGIADAVAYYYRAEPVLFAEVSAQIERYLATLSTLKLREEQMQRPRYRLSLRNTTLRAGLLTLLTGLFIVWGMVINAVPYLTTRLAGRFLAADETKRSTAKLLSGAIAFPLWYALAAWFVWSNWGPALALLYLLSLPPCGFYARWWSEQFRQYRRLVRFVFATGRRRTLYEALQAERASLLEELDGLRDRYLKEQMLSTRDE